MDEIPTSNAIKKRLSMQNEVLKWLSEFSEKMQKRADNAAMEIKGLLDEAGVVELDLKNTYNSFRNLSYHRFVDHASTALDRYKISDEDDADSYLKDGAESSVQADIRAQDYETDILPRYKEALSLGLTSCRDHLQNTKKSHSTTSVFRTGLANGPLPHIIGSEEYMHDNSCGLTEDFALGTSPLDFSWIVDSKGISSEEEEHGPSNLYGSPMFGMQQGLLEKDGTEPLASAALDFKAMLEAALLNPYKFYDEESLSVNNAVSIDRGTGQTHMDAVITSGAPEAVSLGSPQHLGVIEEKAIPVTEGNLTSLQGPDIHANELYSALVAGSLFDAEGEEDSLSFCQKEPVDISASVADSISAHTSTIDVNEIVGGTQSSSIHENLGSSDQISGAPEAVSLGSPQHLDVIEEKAIPVTEGNLTSLQDQDIHANELYSALVSGSLFDAEGEEDSLSFCQKEPVDISASAADSISAHASTIDVNEIVDGTQSLSIHENLGSSDQSLTVHVCADTSISINEESGQTAPIGDVSAFENDASLMSQTLSSSKLKEDDSSSFVTSSDGIRSHNLVPESSEGKPSAHDRGILQDVKELTFQSSAIAIHPSFEGSLPEHSEAQSGLSDCVDEGK